MFQSKPEKDESLEKEISQAVSQVEKKEKPSKKKQSFEVHSMPSKFHLSKTSGSDSSGKPGGSFEKPKDKKKGDFGKIVLYVVVAVVVIGLGVIGYLIYQRGGETETQNNNTTNSNSNTNVVVNASLNIDTNRNTNTANSNTVNTNANTNTNTNGNTNTSGQNKTLFELASSQDLDNDGLTDLEEETLGTSKTTEDSDSDTFGDGTEVLFGYSPNNKGKLEDDRKVSLHTNNTYGFTYLYPTDWTLQLVGDSERGVYLFPEKGDEFIEVSVQDNIGRLSPEKWYLKEVPTASASLIKEIENWEEDAIGVQSIDGYSVHFGNGNYMYTFYYNTGNKDEVDYKTFFEMIYKSVAFFTPVPNTNTNSAINTNLSTNTNTNTNGDTNSLSNTTITIPLNTNTNSNTNTNTNANANSNTNS